MAENQHFVPRFILKNFTAHGKKPQVFVFDKTSQNVFKTHIKNVACEGGFYNIDFKGMTFSLEGSLANFEDKISGVIRSIIEKESLRHIDKKAKSLLSLFFALQFCRTKQFRQVIRDMLSQVEEHIRNMGFDPSEVKGFEPVSDESIRRLGLKTVLECQEFAPHFYAKDWMLLRTSPKAPFILSDNPVGMQNRKDISPFFGNLGLAARGIELYFPISTRLTLAMLCPTHRQATLDAYLKYKLICQLDPRKAAQMNIDLLLLESAYNSYETGSPVDIKAESVMNCNSLQIIASGRQLYSHDGDFSLAIEMLSRNPELTKGRSIKVN